jgi:hypothetical protein
VDIASMVNAVFAVEMGLGEKAVDADGYSCVAFARWDRIKTYSK